MDSMENMAYRREKSTEGFSLFIDAFLSFMSLYILKIDWMKTTGRMSDSINERLEEKRMNVWKIVGMSY